MGLIPPSALEVGLEIRASYVRIHFQLTKFEDEEAEDIAETPSYFGADMGPDVEVEVTFEVLGQREKRPEITDWVFLEQIRYDHEAAQQDIEVASGVPLISQPDGPLFGFVVYEEERPVGLVDLWISARRLTSFEHSWFTEEVGPLPRPEQLGPNTTQ